MGRLYASAFVTDVWTHVAMTYSGGGIATSVKIYQDGVQVDDTSSTTGSFTAMEDLADTFHVNGITGTGGTVINAITGQFAGGPLGPFFTKKELTGDEVLRLYNLDRGAMYV